MNRRTIRRGYSILEMMVVLSVASTLMVVAVGWIHQSMKLSSVMRHRQEHHQSLLRLSRKLRDDVHRGESMQIEGDTELVILFADGHTVTYTISNRGLSCRSQRQGKIDQRDSFDLVGTASARWDTTEMPGTVSLVVDRHRNLVSQERQQTAASIVSHPPVADLYVRTTVGRWRDRGIVGDSAP